MSAALAAVVAHVTFWVLLLYGWAADHLKIRSLVVFVAVWVTALVGLPHLPWSPATDMFPSVVAVLDLVLVLVILKGDIRVT